MVRVETVLGSWKAVRQDTAQAVLDMPPGELDFKPIAEVDSFGTIARHILDAGHALTGLLLAGVDNLATPEFRKLLKNHVRPLPETVDAATLAAELRSSLEERCAELAKRPAEFFSQLITRFDGEQVTRLEMIQFVKEHELTHRAQLFMYLRMKGIVPATTRRRLQKK